MTSAAVLWAAGALPQNIRDAFHSSGVSVCIAGSSHNLADEVDSGACSALVIGGESIGIGAAERISELTERFPDVSVIAIVDDAEERATELIRAGASDVLASPVDLSALLPAVQKALAASAAATAEAPRPLPGSRSLLGTSKPMLHVQELIRRAASGNATVLIRGESGTGKELVARAIHGQSRRAQGPFVKIQCAALPDTLLESELFGHEKGAFTGAISRKEGRVEVAEHGTLFLDEIGDITPSMQVKLLRLLQDREYERLGSNRTRQADVRFLAATHRDLEGMVGRGEFREDLFYRLNVIPLWLPPLRARRDDIELLARHFCTTYGAANDKARISLSDDAIAYLRAQRWPGNVRQLQNFIERLVVLTEALVITKADVERELHQTTQFTTQAAESIGARLPPAVIAVGHEATDAPVLPLSDELRAAEKRALERALKAAKGNRTVAARILGVSRATLYAKLQQHELA